MKYFKITKTWAVKAEAEAEAIKLIAADPVEYLDSETVTRTEYKKPQPKTGCVGLRDVACLPTVHKFLACGREQASDLPDILGTCPSCTCWTREEHRCIRCKSAGCPGVLEPQ